MSSLIDFDDDDFFAKGESSKTPEKSLDEIFGTTKEEGSNNLDDIFGSNETTKKQPLSEKQIEDLFGKTNEDEFDFFARGDEIKPKVREENQDAPKPPPGFDDSFAMLVQANLDQSGSGKKPHDKTPDLDFLLESQPAGLLDSTDSLLMFDPFAEPPRKPRSPVLNPKMKKSTELKIDPSDEFFADAPLSPRLVQQQLRTSQPPSETVSKMEDGIHVERNGGLKKKRSMERSFEDLLHGLSDDDDLDLDDLVGDNTGYSTNLESILPSPGKSQPSEDTDKDVSTHDKDFFTPDKDIATPDKHFSHSADIDLFTSTPNIVETGNQGQVKEPGKFEDDFKFVNDDDDVDNGEVECGIPGVTIETPEGVVNTPDSDDEGKDLDDQDLKSWEMVDREDVADEEEEEEEGRGKTEEEIEEDMNNSAQDGVVMRRRRPKTETNGTDMRKDESIDLSDVEDTNQLDVDINKHKSSLSKRGSLALRRKPSRKNRRSLITEGEEVLFKDSTRPRAESLPNGELFVQGDGETSLSAKKTPPSFMMPLPGMAARPPHRSSLSSPDDDTETATEPRRSSKPPPGAFCLPAVAPRSSRPKSEILSTRDVSPTKESQSSVFEKPALRSVSKTPKASAKSETNQSEIASVSHGLRSHDHSGRSHGIESHDLERKRSEERDVMFEQPALKSVSKTNKTTPSGEKDFTFEKPKLRSRPKPDSVKTDSAKTENTGSYTKPALRSTPKPSMDRDAHKDDSVDSYAKEFDPSALRETPKRSNYSGRNESDKHSFEKPVLRTGSRTLNSEIDDNETDLTNSHDKQSHARTHSNRKEPEMNGFHKDSHTFDKPVLRNTPAKVQREERGSFKKPVLRKSPEKQLSKDENKGVYDKPLLRKTENALSEDKTHISSGADKDYSSRLPEMKLRKTETPSKDDKSKSSEKPAWLQAAKNKGSKALDAIQCKENFENHYLGKTENSTPSWLEKPALKKSPNPAVPLQETSQNVGTSQNQTGSVSSELSGSQSSLSDERRSSLTESRSRRSGSSGSTDSDSYKGKDRKTGKDSNYSPSWMRQLTPAKSTPSIPSSSSDEVPQWKKDLLQRKNRKNQWEFFDAQWKNKEPKVRKWLKKSTGVSETPQRRGSTEPSPEPEWKGNIQLRKVRQSPGPVKETTPAEPEWKRAAEEKKARLRRSVLNDPSIDSERAKEEPEESHC